MAGTLILLNVVRLAAQAGDLPVPENYESNLISRGMTQRYLPVQADTLVPTGEDYELGWLVYQRDRNYEVLPNSKPAPDERPGVLRIVATPGEIESEPFSVYALKKVESLRAQGRVIDPDESSAWLLDAVVV